MAWKIPTTPIDTNMDYSASDAVHLLGVTAETVKSYCRDKKLKARRAGPKKEWSISGAGIKKLRDSW